MNQTKEQKEEYLERGFHSNQRKAWKKARKPVTWNGMEFESARALGRYLKLSNHDMVTSYIKSGTKLKGYVPEFIRR